MTTATTIAILEAARMQALRDGLRHMHARRWTEFSRAITASAVYGRMIRRARAMQAPLRVVGRGGVLPLEVRL